MLIVVVVLVPSPPPPPTMQPIPNPMLGGCICGALRYRIIGEPLTLYTCHCTDCQRQGGSAFGMSMTLLKTQFELLSGTPRIFTKTFPDDGRQKFTRFCADCGTRLWTDFTKGRDVMNVRPGTLDDTRWLTPIAHIWTASAQPWVTIPDCPLNCPGQPADMTRYAQAWRDRALAAELNDAPLTA